MDEQPLDVMKRWLNLVVNLTFLGFVLSVVVLVVIGSPQSVQRLGAFWIAIILFLFGLIKFMVHQLHLAAEGKGYAVSQFEEKIVPNLYSDEKGWLNFMNDKGEEYDRPLYKREEVKNFLEDLEHYVNFHVVIADVFLIAVATLLSGFGDLLFCLFRSGGHVACSV